MKIKNIAERYDIEWADVYEDIEFFKKYAKRYSGPILEMAVGTGRVALELAKAGHVVWGVDKDPDMINICQSKAREMGLQGNINLIESTMERVTINHKFKLIILPGNSFITLLSKEAQLAALNNIRAHLSDDGLAIIPIISWEEHIRSADQVIPCRIFDDPENNSTYHKTTRLSLHLNTQELQYHYYYDVVDSNSNVTRTQSTVNTRMVFRYEMELLVECAGMMINNIYGNYDEAELAPGKPWMIFTIKKV